MLCLVNAVTDNMRNDHSLYCQRVANIQILEDQSGNGSENGGNDSGSLKPRNLSPF